MIIKYTFDYDYYSAQAIFTVDTEIFTSEHANSTLDFFDWEYDKDEDPIREVMKKYAIEVIKIATTNNLNVNSVISEFKGSEGFAPIDGSVGVLLTSIKGYDFDEDKFDIEAEQDTSPKFNIDSDE